MPLDELWCYNVFYNLLITVVGTVVFFKLRNNFSLLHFHWCKGEMTECDEENETGKQRYIYVSYTDSLLIKIYKVVYQFQCSVNR